MVTRSSARIDIATTPVHLSGNRLLINLDANLSPADLEAALTNHLEAFEHLYLHTTNVAALGFSALEQVRPPRLATLIVDSHGNPLERQGYCVVGVLNRVVDALPSLTRVHLVGNTDFPGPVRHGKLARISLAGSLEIPVGGVLQRNPDAERAVASLAESELPALSEIELALRAQGESEVDDPGLVASLLARHAKLDRCYLQSERLEGTSLLQAASPSALPGELQLDLPIDDEDAFCAEANACLDAGTRLSRLAVRIEDFLADAGLDDLRARGLEITDARELEPFSPRAYGAEDFLAPAGNVEPAVAD